MILGAFESLLDCMPPAWLRKAEVKTLMSAFAKAFDVEPLNLDNMPADEALAAFREFTATCMETALEDREVAIAYRECLNAESRALGHKVRFAVPVRPSSVFRLVKFLYRGIGIDLSEDTPGTMCFGPCSFAQRYTPADCWFMSAFDEGFMCGIMGIEGKLCFDCRLTEGAACCRARLEQE